MQINAIKSREIKKIIADSAFTTVVPKGGRLMKTTEVMSEQIVAFDKPTKVTIMDYRDAYFVVCVDTVCGYMNEVWVIMDEEIKNYVELKKVENIELKKLEEEQKLKKQKDEWAAIEKKYIKKYGQATYNKLKNNLIWLGMTKEMATISWGSPNDINRTVGSWGVHEQWVYGRSYLYFENGILKSYQNQ